MRREKALEADKDFFRELNELSYRRLVTEQFGEWDKHLQSAKAPAAETRGLPISVPGHVPFDLFGGG